MCAWSLDASRVNAAFELKMLFSDSVLSIRFRQLVRSRICFKATCPAVVAMASYVGPMASAVSLGMTSDPGHLRSLGRLAFCAAGNHTSVVFAHAYAAASMNIEPGMSMSGCVSATGCAINQGRQIKLRSIKGQDEKPGLWRLGEPPRPMRLLRLLQCYPPVQIQGVCNVCSACRVCFTTLAVVASLNKSYVIAQRYMQLGPLGAAPKHSCVPVKLLDNFLI